MDGSRSGGALWLTIEEDGPFLDADAAMVIIAIAVASAVVSADLVTAATGGGGGNDNAGTIESDDCRRGHIALATPPPPEMVEGDGMVCSKEERDARAPAVPLTACVCVAAAVVAAGP